tara:strand:+ start:60 stop:503 length:444 start_codon:yes stop_codon:yes gene_type:complete
VDFTFKKLKSIIGNGTSQSLGDVHYWLERDDGTIIADTLTKYDETFLKGCAETHDCNPHTLYYAEFDKDTAIKYFNHWNTNHKVTVERMERLSKGKGVNYGEVGYNPQRCFSNCIVYQCNNPEDKTTLKIGRAGFKKKRYGYYWEYG